MNLLRAALSLCLALALLPAYGESLTTAASGNTRELHLPAADTTASGFATLFIGNRRIHAEIAATPQSRERGLMQRTHLCADCGMLFVFDKAEKHAFWMKNTPLPLSIAFIAADSRILNIDEMRPHTTDDHLAQGDALYALEMNSGWFAGNSIKPGDKVKGLDPALHKRQESR